MAATDKPYRDQRLLDIVFGVSSLLMLLSVVWMFADDYYREFKTEQRQFRDVLTAMAQRTALDQLPSKKDFADAKKKVEKARKEREANEDKIKDLRQEARDLLAKREKADAKYQNIKADLDSTASFYDIAVEQHGAKSEQAKRHADEVMALKIKLDEALSEREDVTNQIKDKRAKADSYERPLTVALGELKQVNDRFDAQVKVAIGKRWGLGDTFRNLPILDAFAAPVKIEQFTLDNLPIDYNFKHVTRYDRCTTCHQGIERNGYSKASLRALAEVTGPQDTKLEEARELLRQRREALQGLPDLKDVADPDQVQLTTVPLSEARVNEFCAHPRLDMFVSSNSKHPSEKFGCTTCHSGQGSATDFLNASHTPNNTGEKERWVKDHGWQSNHYWDFPMLPHRFVESSCLKCHHQVTDLITTDNRNQAPKLLRGYYLLRENGCFGCHEIAGRKNGREVGPDIRLENNPPLESLSPGERTKIMADPDTAPGNMRKVGPSLYRVSEKTNPEWVIRWLRAPREFRPDTKMPHFYGLSNNNPLKLSDELDGPSQLPGGDDGQAKFPNAEIQSIAYYLFKESRDYLEDVSKRQNDSLEERRKDEEIVGELQAKDKLNKQDKEALDAALSRIRHRQSPAKLPALQDYDLKGYKENVARGRKLFTERGCLACHHHDATMTEGDGLTALPSEANFGPNLTQVKAKLGQKPGDMASAKRWLMQWIKDPHIHSPRSRMPVTHLTDAEVADVAAWLLSKDPQASDFGPRWDKLPTEEKDLVKEPEEKVLQALAKVYLVRLLPPHEIRKLDKEGKASPERIADLPPDDKAVASDFKNVDRLKHYLGKKAVGRYGCYACHDIPGFDNAKTIGVGLLDWGKKSPERLAFEDSEAFVKDNFVNEEGKSFGKEPAHEPHSKKKLPFDNYLAEALFHHQRDGYLNLKVMDPRSYDYNRIRPYDDRSRMPQFKLARSRKREGEKAEAYEARLHKEEAEAREAIMTFVLGLVAEPVPLAMINQPSGDRLAEVKGRQVLDKYNCAGCHLIRPGAYDFNLSTAGKKVLQAAYETSATQLPSDYNFWEHKNWAGHLPPSGSDTFQAMAVKPGLLAVGKDKQGKEKYQFTLRLTEALRFMDSAGEPQDIRASNLLRVLPEDMAFPPAEVFRLPEDLDKKFKAGEQREKHILDQVRAWEANHGGGALGGTFADLLVEYLMEANPTDYKADPSGDNSAARASVPPILLGQGERTQPEWLFHFLLNPERVRRMTILRMPRFNMSEDESRALVSYFAGVERLTNPGIGLTYPQAFIPQQADLSDFYWREKTKAYVARLKATKVKGPDGMATNKTLLEQRLSELEPVWTQIEKDYKKQLTAAESKRDAAAKKLDAAKEALKNAKDADKAAKEEAQKNADQDLQTWKTEAERLKGLTEKSSVKEQEAAWTEGEAYLTDAYRVVANRNLCLTCHQLGNQTPGEGKTQGPPLDLTAIRLRPGWTERWIAHPQRYLTYASVMPQNFPANKMGEYQQWFAGTPLDQVIAVRDMLMIYPRAAEMPVNRYWSLPATIGESK